MTRFGYFVVVAMLSAWGADDSARAAMLHLWDFEQAAPMADSVGGLHLIAAPGEGDVGGVFGTAGDIGFEPGFGGVGQAYRPYYVDASQSFRAGAGLTGSGFVIPTQFTIEAIVKADAKTSTSALNYLFQTRPDSDRGYFLVQNGDGLGPGAVGGLGTVIGQAFANLGSAGEYDADGTWLYVAAVIDQSPIGETSADLYLADLSAGDTAPVLVADDFLWVTNDTLEGETGFFGVGGFAIDRDGDGIGEASQEWFQGAVDYVAIYDGLLNRNELATNLSERLSAAAAPEPATASLALLGLGGLMLRRRRSA